MSLKSGAGNRSTCPAELSARVSGEKELKQKHEGEKKKYFLQDLKRL